MQIQQSRLSNGLLVITSYLPGFDSSAVAAFVNAGSRHERKEQNGLAHFLEHMAFKSTSTRTASDLAHQLEVLGSNFNAFTSNSMTAYYATGLATNFAEPLRIIGDVLTDSQFSQSDIDLESGVILQEISQYDDDPGSVMHHLLDATAYPDQPVGRPILGDPNFVRNATTADFKGFVGEHYSAETMIVVAVGGIQNDEVLEIAEKAFAKVPASTSRPATVPASYAGGVSINGGREFKQVHAGISFPSVSVTDNAMHAHMLLASAFGGGMSSPLFTEIREKRGLVYHTSCYGSFESDHGEVSIIGGMTPENLDEFVTVACQEFAKMRDSVNETDLTRAKNSALVQIATLRERPFSAARFIAGSQFNWGHVRDLNEIRQSIEAVTVDDLKAAAHTLLQGKPAVALVGPVPDHDYADMIDAALA